MRISPQEAISQLKTGGVVALPTETVYGLAAAINQPAAIERVFSLKGRPADNPLIVHLADSKDLLRYLTQIPSGVGKLSELFWPGPLTVVVPVNTAAIPENVRAGLPTAAFRIPKQRETREIIRQTGALVMPSANLSGRPSATEAEHVEEDFGDKLPVVDGGPCFEGVESTIVHYNQDGMWEILRLGAIAPEELEEALGYIPEVVTNSKTDSPLCPGQKYRHYAPKAKLAFSDEASSHTGVVIGFDFRDYPEAKKVYILGPEDDPEEVAHNMYRVLRQLDLDAVKSALIDADMPQDGLWLTIRERLQKATAN